MGMHVLVTTNHDEIVRGISALTPEGANFSNGTYATQETLPLSKILPTVIAGFQYITTAEETAKYHSLPIVVLLNSDESLKQIGKIDFAGRDQMQRAEDIGTWLQQCFPDNEIILCFYDETTPTELYEKLNGQLLTKTHHKWGYGTKPNQPIIEGAEYFDMTFGFPMPDDTNPVCYNETRMPDPNQPQQVHVVDLRDTLIDEDRQLLFDNPYTSSLQQSKRPSCRMM